jgi:copper resistance protein B
MEAASLRRDMAAMRAVEARRRSSSVIASIALAMTFGARGIAQSAETPVGLPAHDMLEDPFNRSIMFDELELHDGDDLRWDASAWLGYSFNKLAVRTEGERAEGDTERAELQLLWTHAFARWWDVVAGARADFEPGTTRNWAAFGVQGLAPYRFDLEATAFVGENGDTAARFEGKYDLLITSRLIVQPQLELNWYGQADRARRLGSGLSSVEVGLRLRYELRREVAPYVGVVRTRLVGGTADQARSGGFDADDSSFAAGVRLRF